MARRRNLRPDEEDLWQAVARTARPSHPKPMHRVADPAPTLQHKPEPLPKPRLPSFHLGEKVRTTPAGPQLAPTPAEALAAAALRMDAKTHARMTRGKLAPEARIDLHGLTLTEAHGELVHFILNAQSAGQRLVLVITGKGKRGLDSGPIPQRIGALRHQVPQWLRLPPLGPAVLQIAEAHLKHGGSGAYYVYLRRR